MKNMDDLLRMTSVAQRKPSLATTKLMPFTVRKDEWNTKEYSGKSLKNALDVLWYAKGTSQAEAKSNSQTCSLSRYQVTLV